MAYQEPIILDSNIIPGGFGALPNVYYENPDQVQREGTVENEDGTFTIPTYTIESNTPTFDLSEMQNLYGTEYMPMFEWITQTQTGSYVYDPEEDTKEIDSLKEKFAKEQGEAAEDALARQKEMYKQEAIGVATQMAAGAGAQIGRAYGANMGTDAAGLGGAFDAYKEGGFTEILGYGAADDPSKITSKISSSGPFDQGRLRFNLAQQDNAAGKAAKAALEGNSKNPLAADASQKYLASIDADSSLDDLAKTTKKDSYTTAMAVIPDAPKSWSEKFTDRTKSFGDDKSSAGTANLYGSIGAGGATLVANLIAGKNLKESAKAGVKAGLGTYVGTAIGGVWGGLIGGILGGRVICNELMRQGIMTRKQVVLDYKFTEDYLTPQHVAGYHVWAVWMVRQMRKGRLVNFWTHVAGHRANEIAYIYGERDKPDYLGKVYRKILEPICWSIGFFCKKTDWTVLYKQKEV